VLTHVGIQSDMRDRLESGLAAICLLRADEPLWGGAKNSPASYAASSVDRNEDTARPSKPALLAKHLMMCAFASKTASPANCGVAGSEIVRRRPQDCRFPGCRADHDIILQSRGRRGVHSRNTSVGVTMIAQVTGTLRS